jgi:hypothetical protein
MDTMPQDGVSHYRNYANYSKPDPEYWCPECIRTCIKDANTVDNSAVMRYCSRHTLSLEGECDEDVTFDMQYPGMVSGGQEARDLCDAIHRDQWTRQ